MCDGCSGTFFVRRLRDGKDVPLHRHSKTGQLFVFESWPVFAIKQIHLEEGKLHG